MYTFHQYVSNMAPGAIEAIEALKALVAKHDANAITTNRPGSPVLPSSAVFSKTAKTVSVGWSDVCQVLGIPNAVKMTHRPVAPESIKDVPVKTLVSTQPNILADIIGSKIESPLDLWSTHEVPLFVEKNGTVYIFDGHHRVAAAILLNYETIRGQVVHL